MQTPVSIELLAYDAYQAKKDAVKSAFACNSADETMRVREEILNRLHKLLPDMDLSFELRPTTKTVVLLDSARCFEFCLVRINDGNIPATAIGLVRKCHECGRQEIVIINELADLGQALKLGIHPLGCPTITFKGMR